MNIKKLFGNSFSKINNLCLSKTTQQNYTTALPHKLYQSPVNLISKSDPESNYKVSFIPSITLDDSIRVRDAKKIAVTNDHIVGWIQI